MDDLWWHLPDKFVNQQTNYSSTCTTYVRNDNLLTNTAVQCWYVNGSGGACSVRETLHFSNGQTASVAANGNFTVYGPTISLEALTAEQQDRYYTIDYANDLTCKLKLGENDDSGDGTMRFTVDIWSQYSGSFGLTQLITANYSNPLFIFSVERCDGSEIIADKKTFIPAIILSQTVRLFQMVLLIWMTAQVKYGCHLTS